MFEYLVPRGPLRHSPRTEPDQLFATAASRSELTDAQADEAIEMMRCYYDEGKAVYGQYFGHLKNFLCGVGASYHKRSAAHLDLVQESTNPVWGSLCPGERSSLLERDLPFLVWQLENLPQLQAVVCAGKTVSSWVKARVPIDVKETGSIETRSIKQVRQIRWWVGTAHVGKRGLPIGGWNYPLDRPTGLGTAGEIELGRMFKRKLPF